MLGCACRVGPGERLLLLQRSLRAASPPSHACVRLASTQALSVAHSDSQPVFRTPSPGPPSAYPSLPPPPPPICPPSLFFRSTSCPSAAGPATWTSHPAPSSLLSSSWASTSPTWLQTAGSAGRSAPGGGRTGEGTAERDGLLQTARYLLSRGPTRVPLHRGREEATCPPPPAPPPPTRLPTHPPTHPPAQVKGGKNVARYYIRHGSFWQDMISTAVWVTQVGCAGSAAKRKGRGRAAVQRRRRRATGRTASGRS